MNEDGPEALAVVEDFYIALNAGDAAAIRDLSPGVFFDQGASRLAIAVEGAGAETDHECRLDQTQPTVICEETVTDDLYGPAGIVHQATIGFHVTEDRLHVTGVPPFVCAVGDPTGAASEFLVDFRVWAATAHPELESSWLWGEPIDSQLAIPCTPYPFNSAEAAAQICKTVSEFVAQSDRWPIADT